MLAIQVLAIAAVALLLRECDSAFVFDSNGIVEVAINTRGDNPGPGRYSLIVDGDLAYDLPAAGSVTLELSRGEHSVRLAGLAGNCVVNGANPRTVVVGSGGGPLSFDVVCEQVPVNDLTVFVSTTGSIVDPDGYGLSVAGVSQRPIAINAVETYTGLTPGVHLITLKDLAAGCAVVGGNPQPHRCRAGESCRGPSDGLVRRARR